MGALARRGRRPGRRDLRRFGVPGGSRPSRSQALLAGFFIVAGALHLSHPRRYEEIVPPRLPWRRGLVYVSGAAEIAGGAAVLVPPLRPWAGPWLVSLLAAVFPANVHMAFNPDEPAWRRVPRALLWLRLPLQPLLGWWAWRSTRR